MDVCELDVASDSLCCNSNILDSNNHIFHRLILLSAASSCGASSACFKEFPCDAVQPVFVELHSALDT
jgi:hypothetical protein